MPGTTEAPILGANFTRAFARAAELHRHHTRKGTKVPYLGHLMSVAALVLEDGGDEKPGWKTRKTAYLARVARGHGNRASLADKLHNARSILRDHRADPDGIWDRFSVEKKETLWYYRSLVNAYREAGTTGYLIEELDRVVGKLESREVSHEVR
jgi:(p)ppGpp synthase/HD superfamily hydrolase